MTAAAVGINSLYRRFGPEADKMSETRVTITENAIACANSGGRGSACADAENAQQSRLVKDAAAAADAGRETKTDLERITKWPKTLDQIRKACGF